MSDITTAPFDRHGIRINWGSIWKVIGFLVPIGLAAGLLYLSSIFVSKPDLHAATAPYAPLPAKVHSLEEFRERQEVAQSATTVRLDDLRIGQATLFSQQIATDKKIDRVLDAMERMNQRAKQ